MKLGALLIVFIVLCMPNSVMALTKIGVMGASNPEVSASDIGSKTRVMHIGNDVFYNEIITTDSKGNAQIIFLDKSALTIGPNSSIMIDRFIYNPYTKKGELAVNAIKGAFRFVGGALSKQKAVIIKTPVSTIGIRGGIVMFDIQDNGVTDATFVYGDEMKVTNLAGQSQSVFEYGYHSEIATGSSIPTIPVQVSEVKMAGVLSGLSAKPGTNGGAVVVPTQEAVKGKVKSTKVIHSDERAQEHKPKEPKKKQEEKRTEKSKKNNDSEQKSENLLVSNEAEKDGQEGDGTQNTEKNQQNAEGENFKEAQENQQQPAETEGRGLDSDKRQNAEGRIIGSSNEEPIVQNKTISADVDISEGDSDVALSKGARAVDLPFGVPEDGQEAPARIDNKGDNVNGVLVSFGNDDNTVDFSSKTNTSENGSVFDPQRKNEDLGGVEFIDVGLVDESVNVLDRGGVIAVLDSSNTEENTFQDPINFCKDNPNASECVQLLDQFCSQNPNAVVCGNVAEIEGDKNSDLDSSKDTEVVNDNTGTDDGVNTNNDVVNDNTETDDGVNTDTDVVNDNTGTGDGVNTNNDVVNDNTETDGDASTENTNTAEASTVVGTVALRNSGAKSGNAANLQDFIGLRLANEPATLLSDKFKSDVDLIDGGGSQSSTPGLCGGAGCAHLTWGAWNYAEQSDKLQIERVKYIENGENLAVKGNMTENIRDLDIANIPGLESGVVNYSGDIFGSYKINGGANILNRGTFNAQIDLSGQKLTDFSAQLSSGGAASLDLNLQNDAAISSTGAAIFSGVGVTGQFNDSPNLISGLEVSGTVNGALFGPKAEEIGGNYSVSGGQSASESISGQAVGIENSGVFLGKR